MKKIYSAPKAQILCFAPQEEITANTGWQGSSNDSWWTNGFFWKSSSFLADPANASKIDWFNFGLEEINDSATTN